MPWFRMYSEILDDRKIARISRAAEVPKATVIGVWTVLLALASESPERGSLLISDNIPFTVEELCDETGLDHDTFSAIMTQLQSLGMLALEGETYKVVKWGTRQYASDNSTERVKRFRQRQKATNETFQGNGDETLQQRYSNVAVTPSDTDTDTDTDTEGEGETRTHTPPRENLAALRIYYEETDCGLSETWRDRVQDTIGSQKKDLDRWRQTIIAWLGCGWRPGNVAGMLDYYTRGQLPGHHDATGPPEDRQTGPIIIKGLDVVPEWLVGAKS